MGTSALTDVTAKQPAITSEHVFKDARGNSFFHHL